MGAELSCVARISPSDDERAVSAWVRDRITAFGKNGNKGMDMDSETCVTADIADPNCLALGERAYRLTILASKEPSEGIVGAVVLSGSGSVPIAVVQTIVERLTLDAGSSAGGPA